MRWLHNLVLSLIVLMFLPVQSWAVPAFVQSAQKAAGVVTSTTLAYTTNVTAGSLKLVIVMSGSTTAPTSITDNNGGTSYTKDREQVQTLDGHIASIWSWPNATAGATTVTVNTASTNIRMVILEYSGIATSSALDQVNSAQINAQFSGSSGNITTTNANEVLVASYTTSTSDAGITPNAGFTEREVIVNGAERLEVSDMVVSSTGTYSSTPTSTSSLNVTSLIASYQAPASAAVLHNLQLLGVGK